MFKALAIQLNMFCVCYGSQVNVASTDNVAFTYLSKSPAKSHVSIWSLSSQSKGVDALLFKLHYIVWYAYAFKNKGHKNSKLLRNYKTCRVSCLKEHGNNFLSQYSRRIPHNVNPFLF